MTLRVALIGFGHIAQRAHVAALEANGCIIVAVVEPCPSRQKLARELLPQARLFEQTGAMLAACSPELVDICTPPHLHFQAAQQALESGAHVLCEKPLVVNPKDAAQLQLLAHQHQRVVTCVHNWTEAPIVAAALHLVHANRVGPLEDVFVETLRTGPAQAAGTQDNWRIHPERAGGGILFDHGWHALSVILQAGQSGIARVRGAISKQRHHHLAVEDTVDTHVMLHNGVTGRCLCTWAANERRNTMTFRGARGQVAIVNDTLTAVVDGEEVVREVFEESLIEGGYRPQWTQAIVAECIAEIGGHTPHGDSLEEALQIMRAITATYESALKNGQAINTAQPAHENWRQALDGLKPAAA